MAITVTYAFWVRVDTPAGPDANEVTMRVDFETDDVDHAMELAERHWDSMKPVDYIDGTLNIN